MSIETSRNELVTAFAFALDFLEAGFRKNITNHNKRVSLIAVYLGEALGQKNENLFDLSAYACLHDNGITHQAYNAMSANGQERLERTLSHCIIGEQNLKAFPFFQKRENVIRYHHEAYDGSGHFGLSGEDIPLFSQIIALADTTELLYRSLPDKQDIIDMQLKAGGTKFSPLLMEVFAEVTGNTAFWLSLDDLFLSDELHHRVPRFSFQATWMEMLPVAEMMSKIIDAKSPFTGTHSQGIAQKAGFMADYYGFDADKKNKLLIAAGLHDVGKLVIPNSIIDKPGKLTPAEFEMIKSHTFYTRKVLETIKGFEDITEWASNHHEKRNGRGYPYGLNQNTLDFEAQLMACLDIYQALTEDRPYRVPLTHQEATGILYDMAKDGAINGEIVSDITEHWGKQDACGLAAG